MAETLGVVSGIIAVADLTYRTLGYLKRIHVAEKEVLDYNREAPNFAELLTSLAAHVARSGGENGDPWFESVQTLQRGPMQQYQSAIETLREKVDPGTGLRKKFNQRITWKFVKDEVKEILEKMGRLNCLIVIALQNDHFKLSEAIRSITLEIKDDTTVIRKTGERHTAEFAALKQEARTQAAMSSAILENTGQIGAFRAEARFAEETKMLIQVLEWLSDHDHIKEQYDAISRYKEGTGLWLLEDFRFQEWKDRTYDTLFCVGMPGAGKTVMSAMVIRNLLRRCRLPNSQAAVAFLYFRYDLRETQSTERLLGSLLRQLVSQAVKLPRAIEEAFMSRFLCIRDTKLNIDMLQAAVNCFNCVYFVIDALDEGSAKHIKGLISTIRSLQHSRVKLFATSRFIPGIQEQFQGSQSIEIRASDSDIESYTRDRLAELPHCVRNNEALQAEIARAIVSSTQGMFLLAKLYIDSLKDKRTLKMMRKTLQALPSGSSAYDTAYGWAMKRIADQSETDFQLTQQVLTWLVHAMRPLRETDLETALAIKLGDRQVDPDNAVNVFELLSLCAGLVILDEESKTVRLVHYTTQEYYSRHPHHLLQDPHRFLSNVCVSYLGIDDFTAGGYVDQHHRRCSHIPRYSFLSYAAAHWQDHARMALPFANEEEASKTLALDLRILQNPELMESYFMARGKWVQQDTKFVVENKTGMQYAAAMGNFEQVNALLKLGFDPNESRDDTTALIEAARGGDEAIVKLLIEAGASVHFQSEVAKNMALTVALGMEARWTNPAFSVSVQRDCCTSITAREATVALLLDAGADPEHVAKHVDNLTPLMYASKHGMEYIVDMLCNAGAYVNRRGGNYAWGNRGETALHVAAAHGRESVVKRLLQRGCDPNITDNHNRLPALCAAEGGHWTVLDLLLNVTTADMVSNVVYGLTVLELACQSRQCPETLIERLLLSASPDQINARGQPLISAARLNRESVVRMLLEAGADPSLSDTHGNTALHVAAGVQHLDNQHTSIAIAQALLETNIVVDIRGHNQSTALMLASGSGQSDLVKFLLENGASLLSRDDSGWSPVTYAADRGHADIVKSLIYAGADPLSDPLSDLCFFRAASSGHVSILQILTNAGIDVNITAEDGTTALMSAAKFGHLDATRMLLEAGASVNARWKDGTSPLMLSATKGYKELTRLLLTNGADITVTNDRGETALIAVMRTEIKQERTGRVLKGIQDVLPMLLEAGVDVNASAENGDTALCLVTDRYYPRPENFELLLKSGMNQRNALVRWDNIAELDIKRLESLLKAGADPESWRRS